MLPRRVGARQFTPCSGLCLRPCGAARPKRAGGPGKIIMRGSGCHRQRHRPGLRLPRASGAQQAPPPLLLSKATRGLASKGLGLETGPFRPRHGALLGAGTRPLPAPSPRTAPGRDHPPPPAPTKPKKPPTSRQRFRPAPRRAARPRVPPAPTLFRGALPRRRATRAPARAARSDTGHWEKGARQIRRKPSVFIGKEMFALPGTRLSPSSPH